MNNSNIKRVIIYANGDSYDVTDFLNHHPGGAQCLRFKNGKDCSDDYNFHSKHAKKIWKQFKIDKDGKKETENNEESNECIII